LRVQRLMRHAKIDTTMDSHANVDEAVQAAVLGHSPIGLRTKPGSADPTQESAEFGKPGRDKDLGDESQ